MLTGAGLSRTWSHDRAHKFFSRAARSPDTLGMYPSRLIVKALLPPQVAVAVDDTLFKKRGRKVFGAAWQHDGAARGEKPVGYGCCFAVLGIIVELPFCTRPFCLPVAVRLWRPKTGPSKVEIAAALVKQLAAWHRDRTIHVVADAAYHGKALRHLPARITAPPGFPPRQCSTAWPRRRPAGAAGPGSKATASAPPQSCYCDPASEWWIRSRRGAPARSRCHRPISNAANTRGVALLVAADQPTIRREKVSTTKAT